MCSSYYFLFLSRNKSLWRYDFDKQYFWQEKEVFNHIAPIIESRLSKLSKIKPNINIKPSSNTDSDNYKAKLANAIITSNFNEVVSYLNKDETGYPKKKVMINSNKPKPRETSVNSSLQP